MSIWFRPTTIEQVNELFAGVRDISQHLDLRLTEFGDDYLRGTLPVDERTRQPLACCTAVPASCWPKPSAAWRATWSSIRRSSTAVGQQIAANHVRSARSGRVTGTARSVYIGGRSHVWDIEIRDADGKLTCACRLTMAVIAGGRRHRGGARDNMKPAPWRRSDCIAGGLPGPARLRPERLRWEKPCRRQSEQKS